MSERSSFGVPQLDPATRILLGASLLLVVDSFLAWQRFCSVKVIGGTLTGCTFNAWRGNGAFVGMLMGGGAILLVLWSAAEATSATDAFGDLGQTIGAVLVGATVGFGFIKFLVVLFHHATIFAWVGLFLMIAIAYGGYMRMQAPAPSSPATPPPDGGFGL